MKQHTKKTAPLTAERITTYRAAAQPVSIGDRLKSLDICSRHHNSLLDLGLPQVAAAAERAWLEDAVTLAATPAGSAEEGLLKTNYLEACLEAWVMPTASFKGHENTCAILLASAEQEKERWGVQSGTGQAH